MVRIVHTNVQTVLLCGNELNMVGIDNCLLKCGSEVGVDGVDNVSVGAVGIFSRGHYDKISFSRIDNLDVVNGEAIVKGDRNDSLHRTFVEEFSDFDVGDLHNFVSFPVQ